MKSVLKWLLPALLLAGVIIGASVLYNKFGEDYSGVNLSENTMTQAAGPTPSDTSVTTAADEKTTGTSETQENAMEAPDFTVLDYEGKEVRLSDYKGKPVVLNFWATWCYYCTLEMPDFDKAAKDYPEVQFLMVNATDGERETVEIAKQYVEEEGYQFDVFFDTQSEAVYTYYVTAFPTTYFIDSDGNLVAQGNGMLDYATIEKGIKMITEQ